MIMKKEMTDMLGEAEAKNKGGVRKIREQVVQKYRKWMESEYGNADSRSALWR